MTKDGGPAFPMQQHGLDGLPDTAAEWGMSLRDYFAAQALVGMRDWMPGYHPDGSKVDATMSLCNPHIHAARAEWAYAQADAMLKERDK